MVGTNKGVRQLLLWAQPTKWGYYIRVQGRTDDGWKVAGWKKKKEKKKKKDDEKRRRTTKRQKKKTNLTFNDIFTLSEKITTLNFCTLWWPSGQSAQHWSLHSLVLYHPPKKKKGGGGGKHLGGVGAGEHNNNEEMMKTCIMFYKVCGIVKVSLWHAGTYPPAWHSIVGLQWQQLD